MKILIVKTSSLGDIVQSFPVIQYLKHTHSDASIDWVVEAPFAALLKTHPFVENVWEINSKKWRRAPFAKETWREIALFKASLKKTDYDIVFDLQGNTKSGIVAGLAKAKDKVGFDWGSAAEWSNPLFLQHRYNVPVGQNIRRDYLSLIQQHFRDKDPFVDDGIRLRIDEKEAATIQHFLQASEMQSPFRVMVCPGSAWKNKQLSTETLLHFLELIHRNRSCSFAFVWGNEEEKKIGTFLQNHFSNHSLVVDKLSLPGLQNLMSAFHLVISMDSLPLHLAATAGVATFSVFGASSAAKYKPEGKLHIAYQGSCPYGRHFDKRCPILRTCPTGACIKDLKAEDLFNRFRSAFFST